MVADYDLEELRELLRRNDVAINFDERAFVVSLNEGDTAVDYEAYKAEDALGDSPTERMLRMAHAAGERLCERYLRAYGYDPERVKELVRAAKGVD